MTDQPQPVPQPTTPATPAPPVATAAPSSSLDIGSPLAAASEAPTTSSDLVLHPPAPVPAIAPEQAGTMVPLEPAQLDALAQKAQAFVTQLAEMDPRQPEFNAKVRDIAIMGDQDVRAASQVANRMLERPVRALQEARGGGSDVGQARVATGLVELRRTIEDLDPSQVNQGGLGGFISRLPFMDNVKDYFAKYASAQTHLEKIIVTLQRGQEELRKDNAAIEGEKVNLWATMQRMQEYAVLAASLDAAIVQHIETVRLTDPERADQLTSDLLFVIRQKHQDLLTQLAVSAQGYLALDLVRKNNTELIRGVERATTTTVSALRTAIVVAQALANQKLVLDQITALNTTTSNLIVSTSEMLRKQTGEIHTQAASSTVSLDALKQSFANVYATMDAIDTFKVQAVDSMAATVSTLESELGKANSYLSRAREQQERLEGPIGHA